MSLARTSPSLHMRIEKQAWTAIPASQSGITPPRVGSFTERYRGTEFDSHMVPPTLPELRQSTRGRAFVLMSFAALATLGVSTVAALLS